MFMLIISVLVATNLICNIQRALGSVTGYQLWPSSLVYSNIVENVAFSPQNTSSVPELLDKEVRYCVVFTVKNTVIFIDVLLTNV